MAVGGGESVGGAVLDGAHAVAATCSVWVFAYDVAVDADNIGVAAVLAVQCKRLVGGAGVLPSVDDD